MDLECPVCSDVVEAADITERDGETGVDVAYIDNRELKDVEVQAFHQVLVVEYRFQPCGHSAIGLDTGQTRGADESLRDHRIENDEHDYTGGYLRDNDE